MKHSNDGGVLKSAHVYENGSYREVPNFEPSEYPKHVAGKVVNSAEEEKALEEQLAQLAQKAEE